MNRKHIIRQLRNKGIEFDHNLSTKDLDNLLNQPAAQNRVFKSFNFSSGTGKIRVAFNSAEEGDPAEITIAEDIGRDAWTGAGFALKDLTEALDSIVPKTRPLNFLIDSPGGDVNTGKAIHNMLLGWKGVINKTIIGVAASTASWMIPADTTMAYKNSQIFMHRAMCLIGDNVDDLQQGIDFLNKTDQQISVMYADQSGNESGKMLDMMKNETLLTGDEAVACGMVDEIIDGSATNQFSADWINSAKKKLSARNSLSAPGQDAANQQTTNNSNQIMNKTQMLALLNKWGVTVPENATDEQLIALVNAGPKQTASVPPPAPAVANINDHPTIVALNAQIAANRRKDIQASVNQAAADGKIAVLEIENWVNDAVASVDHPTNGNPVLARLSKLENRAPGVPALVPENSKLEVLNADFKDISKGFEQFNEATASWKRGNDVKMSDIANASKGRAQFAKKFRNRFVEAMNVNTVPAALQQQFIMQDVVIRDFARRVLPLSMFGTVFRNVPLLGKDTVEVQYYDLDNTASAAYAGSYDALVSDSVGSSREITVGWGPNKDGAVGKGYARLVQALSFTSQDFARQPYLNIAQRAALKAEKLAYDIFQDVLSVVTVANYPTLLAAGNKIVRAYDQFSSDDLADLKVACKKWPSAGRGLMLDSAYDGNLIKDPSFKNAYAQAFAQMKVDGKLTPELYGFGYAENPNIPQNGINLYGMAFFKYAILVAFAPVPPVEEVRRAGTTWELYTDADSEVSLEYRTYGSNSADAATHVIESNYGYAPGLKTAIKPIVSA